MVTSETERVGALIDLMRAKGATRVKIDGIEIDLAPAPMTIPPTASASGLWPVESAEKCPCGCPLAEHGDGGLCLNGCPAPRCDASEATP